jgi:hypothetical protein
MLFNSLEFAKFFRWCVPCASLAVAGEAAAIANSELCVLHGVHSAIDSSLDVGSHFCGVQFLASISGSFQHI